MGHRHRSEHGRGLGVDPVLRQRRLDRPLIRRCSRGETTSRHPGRYRAWPRRAAVPPAPKGGRRARACRSAAPRHRVAVAPHPGIWLARAVRSRSDPAWACLTRAVGPGSWVWRSDRCRAGANTDSPASGRSVITSWPGSGERPRTVGRAAAEHSATVARSAVDQRRAVGAVLDRPRARDLCLAPRHPDAAAQPASDAAGAAATAARGVPADRPGDRGGSPARLPRHRRGDAVVPSPPPARRPTRRDRLTPPPGVPDAAPAAGPRRAVMPVRGRRWPSMRPGLRRPGPGGQLRRPPRVMAVIRYRYRSR